MFCCNVYKDRLISFLFSPSVPDMDTFKDTIRDMVQRNMSNEEIQAYIDSVNELEVNYSALVLFKSLHVLKDYLNVFVHNVLL